VDSSPSVDASNSPSVLKSRSMDSLTDMASKYIPFIEEVHISSMVSRRGYLNFLDENETGWVKKFVVCRI
jgi:kinesin family protein 1